MSAQQPPSRAPSMGPQNAVGPNAAPPVAGEPRGGGGGGGSGGGGGGGSQNLNQIVLEYLAKKGYSRTEAMLRKESQFLTPDGTPAYQRAEDQGGKAYFTGFDLVHNWVENVLDIYKPELKRMLWPLFVYAFLSLVAEFYPNDSREFFKKYRHIFDSEHEDDVRSLQPISDPAHLETHNIAKIYRDNKYRLTLSMMGFSSLIQHLEKYESEGGQVVKALLDQFFDVRTVDRAAAGNERSLAKLLAKQNGDENTPAEDEGIPGHHPGSANTNRDAPTVLSKLSLGPAPMDSDLRDDVKAELQDHDAQNPPAAGQNSLTEEFEQRIKREETDDIGPRDTIPLPPSTARDVAMEVQKVKENRDRFRIEGRTGGVGPGVSVAMFTLHNTFDTVNCMEFSGDDALMAVGTSESYIRVWSLDGKTLTSPTDGPDYQPSSSRRLIGHSGPVYALSFAPTIGLKDASNNVSEESQPRYLLSSSADQTIRLWSLDTFTPMVIYKSHTAPVWSLSFSPHGHYFASSSADRTAKLWSTAHVSPLRLFVGHDSDAETLCWHPNGLYVFTGAGGGDRTVRMWDIQRGVGVRMFTGHVGNVTSLACAPNGKTVASADDRGEIILWNLTTGRLVKRMRGHGRGGIWSMDWSVESSVLVSGGADGTVRVWDVAPNTEGGGKVIGEGGAGAKVDGAGGPNGVAAGATKGKGKKEVAVSADQISAFPTKKSPVYKVRFTQMNLVVAGGAFMP
ncbi:hypothetical protein MBLNU230_g1373t1 [Neophaeotheca triangularis]